MADPVGWVLRVAGNECRAGLVYAEHTDQEGGGSRQKKGNAVTCFDASVDKLVRYYIRFFIKLFVCEGAVL